MKTAPRGKYSTRGTRKLPQLDINCDVPLETFAKIRGVIQRASNDWGVAILCLDAEGRGVLHRALDELPATWVGTYGRCIKAEYLRDDLNAALAALRQPAAATASAPC